MIFYDKLEGILKELSSAISTIKYDLEVAEESLEEKVKEIEKLESRIEELQSENAELKDMFDFIE